MGTVEDAAWIWAALDYSVTRIFTDIEINKAFVEFDFSIMRSFAFSVRIPPPQAGRINMQKEMPKVFIVDAER